MLDRGQVDLTGKRAIVPRHFSGLTCNDSSHQTQSTEVGTCFGGFNLVIPTEKTSKVYCRDLRVHLYWVAMTRNVREKIDTAIIMTLSIIRKSFVRFSVNV